MKITELITAFDLPAGAMVEQRVPKKLLVENGAPTAADKRRINEGIEELNWVAALKPNTIGVPEYRDELREYLEISVLSVTLRPTAKAARISELVHRAVPYPLVLIIVQESDLILSLAHKRWAQNEADKIVLEGDLVEVGLPNSSPSGAETLAQFRESLSLANQPRTHLFALYQGWVDMLLALQAACLTGTFARTTTVEQAAARRQALQECLSLEAKMASLRAGALKVKQINRQVELNLELKRLQSAHDNARAKL
jgi:hypothetical protein